MKPRLTVKVTVDVAKIIAALSGLLITLATIFHH
jgi:hypothetical protein